MAAAPNLAYSSNLDRAGMAARCPGGALLGRRAWEAFAYLPTDTTEGMPDAQYMAGIVQAARAARLPADYVAGLMRWLPDPGL